MEHLEEEKGQSNLGVHTYVHRKQNKHALPPYTVHPKIQLWKHRIHSGAIQELQECNDAM